MLAVSPWSIWLKDVEELLLVTYMSSAHLNVFIISDIYRGSKGLVFFILLLIHYFYLAMTNCDLQKVGEEFSMKQYTVAVQKGSPLKNKLNNTYKLYKFLIHYIFFSFKSFSHERVNLEAWSTNGGIKLIIKLYL